MANRSETSARNVVGLRLTDAEVATLDRLRQPGESRSAVVRRLLERTAYAQEVALAAVGEGAPPLTGDLRARAAAGVVSVVFPIGPKGGQQHVESVGLAVVDTKSGVTLHEPQRIDEAPAAEPYPARAAALRRLAGILPPEVERAVRSIEVHEDGAPLTEAEWVRLALQRVEEQSPGYSRSKP